MELESIAIRYRIQDQIDNTKGLFSAGFKVMGQGFNIGIANVEKAGASGIMDVDRIWYPFDRASGDLAAPYESGVPLTLLLNQ